MTNKEKLRCILADPILWIETFVSIVDKKGQLVPFKFNPQQKYILKNKGKFNIILKSRQIGITSASLAYSLYIAITKPNSTCMIMSYSLDSANNIFEKLKQMYNDLPDCVRLETIANNRKELKFVNHSRIIVCTCGSKDNARGATLNFVHLSEVGFMNEYLDKQLTAIEQALVPDGCIILESTANGLNRFSELWNKSVSGETPLWKPFFFSWVQDKRMFADEYKEYRKRYKNIYGSYLTKDELDENEIALMNKGASLDQLMWRRLKVSNTSEEKFCQEFPSNPIEAFISTGSGIFNSAIIQERLNSLRNTPILRLPVNRIDPIIKKYNKYLTIWKLPVSGKRYYIGVDTGEGLGGSNDYSVISIIDGDGFQCAEWRSNKVKPYEFAELVFQIAMWYNKGLLIIEKASAGHTVIDKVRHDYHYVNMFKYKAYDQKRGKAQRKIGWETTSKSKPMMISDMQEMFETGQCLVNSKNLLQEMKLFELVDGSMRAVSGHDDTVMAFAMGLQGLKSGQYYFPIGK